MNKEKTTKKRKERTNYHHCIDYLTCSPEQVERFKNRRKKVITKNTN